MRTVNICAMVVIFGLQCPAGSLIAGDSHRIGRVKVGKQNYVVEIADNQELQRRGLMYRTSLPASRGLLMVFKQDKKVPIWMKNTLLPLDVVWLSSRGRVVDLKTLSVCTEMPCPIYYPIQSARYVLEVGAGLFPLNRGDKVEILGASGDSLLPSDLAQ